MKRILAILILTAAPLLVSAQIATTPRVQIFHSSGVYMGVGVVDVTAENLSALKLKEERGVEVVSVSSDSPASKAGLKEHDVVLDYNGTRIEGVDQFRRLISETPAGRTVKLLISRDGVTQIVNVKMEERRNNMHFRSNDDSWFNMPTPPTPPTPPTAPTPPAAVAPRAPRPPRARAFAMPNFDGFNDWFVFGDTPRRSR